MLVVLVAWVPMGATQAQERTISGIVVAEGSLAPVPGAIVQVQGDGRFVVTDAGGRFRLAVARDAAVLLEIRRIGYRQRTQPVAPGAPDLRVILQEGALALDAIVVTGTPGAVEARTVGNAVTRTAVASVLQAAPVASVQDVLATRVPGVMILPTQGLVGTGAVVRIRGASSLSLPNDPLLYVDGVRVDNNTRAGPFIRGGSQVSRLSDLSPEDIESVEVIKGPAAGTLFGTEASRGVIQILTRRGTEGRPRFGLTVRHGANWFRNPAQRLNWAFRRNAAGGLDSINLYQIEAAAGRPIFSTGRPQAYGVSVVGGTPVVRYYAAAGFDRDEGVVAYDWRNRLSARINLSVLPSERLDIETSLGFVRNRARLGQMTSVGREIGWDALTQLNWGGFRYLTGSNRGFYRGTPENIATIESRSGNDRLLSSVQIRHRPWRPVSQRLTIGMDAGDETSSVLFPSDPALPFADLSEGDKTVDRRRVVVGSLDYVATVSATLGTQFALTTSAGLQFYSKRIEFVQAYGHGFPTGVKVVSGAAITTSSEDVVENRGAGAFGQQQLAWKNRRFLTAAVRVDDNSAFGANLDPVTYPKVSASWVLNEERFWPLAFVTALKLRAAWGLAGRQPDAFVAERSYQPVSGPGGVPILTPQNVGNADLKPERGAELEVGFDASLWHDRVSATFTWYDQRLRDAIVSRGAAPSGGFPGNQLVNLGEVRNHGTETSLDVRVLDRASFTWDVGGSFSTNDSRIVSLGGLEPIVLVQSGLTASLGQWHAEGYPVGAYFLPLIVSASLDGNGNAINIQCSSGPENGHAPVACPAAPRLYAGKPTPAWEANVRSSFTLLRNVRLHVTVDARGGHTMWNQTATIAHRQEGNTRVWNDRSDPTLQAYDALALQGIQGAAPRTGLVKGGFAKLREVSVSYTLPSAWIARIGASSATVTVAGRNLALLWAEQPEAYGFRILDPETKNASDLSGNVNNLMPPFTQFMAVIRMVF